MPKSGAQTRERIVDAAQALVYRHGFSATSLDKVIEAAGLTKGAFFYHFKSKGDLGRSLIERYAARDLAHFDRVMARAEKLSGDPRQQALIFVGLLQEEFESLPDPIPGCLFTSYIYEPAAYPADVGEIAVRTLDAWRAKFAAKLTEAMKHQPHHGATQGHTQGPTAPDTLASMLLALIEGGYVLAKAGRDAGVLIDVLTAYRAYLESLFSGGDAAPASKR